MLNYKHYLIRKVNLEVCTYTKSIEQKGVKGGKLQRWVVSIQLVSVIICCAYLTILYLESQK